MPKKTTDTISANTILSLIPSAETVMTEIDKFSASKSLDEQIERNEDKEDECPTLTPVYFIHRVYLYILPSMLYQTDYFQSFLHSNMLLLELLFKR